MVIQPGWDPGGQPRAEHGRLVASACVTRLVCLLMDAQNGRAIVRRVRQRLLWSGTGAFWEDNYSRGGHSGAGSYGHLAEYKAEVLNGLVVELDVRSVIEFGCGDGNQLGLAVYSAYTGLDIAPSAIDRAAAMYVDDMSKSFLLYDPQRWINHGAVEADMAISLDVIFHLIEDDVYLRYMNHLFHAARRHVVIYASNSVEPHPEPYMRHHRFMDWVEQQAAGWQLLRHIPNRYPFDPARPNETSYSDFWVFGRVA